MRNWIFQPPLTLRSNAIAAEKLEAEFGRQVQLSQRDPYYNTWPSGKSSCFLAKLPLSSFNFTRCTILKRLTRCGGLSPGNKGGADSSRSGLGTCNLGPHRYPIRLEAVVPEARYCQPRQNPSGLPPAWQVPRFTGGQRPVGSTAVPHKASPAEGGEGALIIGRASCRSPLA